MQQLTCLIGTYNEANRLPDFLAHARKWADKIVVVDKGSTDETCNIALAAGASVHIVDFTPQGHEDKIEQFSFCETDWVFLMTPGEVPTKELVAKVREAIERHGDEVDIITVPKKLYSFGIHNPSSPWSIGQQPFVVNRKRAVISNHVHRNFTLKAGGKAINIPYSETCHVYHPTHATVKGFLRSHFDYIIAESEGQPPDALRTEALRQIAAFDFGNHNPELFGQECAWKLYWLGCCLAAWEKKVGKNVPQEYQAETRRRLAAEWGILNS